MSAPRHIPRCHAWIFRVAAVCLLLLTASPFTAPFATCDVADAVLHTGIDEGGDFASKIAGDTAIAVGLAHAVFALASSHAQPEDDRNSLVSAPGPSLFALRL